MTVETGAAHAAGPDTGERGVPERSVELQREITEALGWFPPFFVPALPDADLLQAMWHQMVGVYTNPIPLQSKARLFAYLSNVCEVPYMTAVHSCHLLELGANAGEIVELLRSSSGPELDAPIRRALWDVQPPLTEWPESGSPLDAALHHAAVRLFLSREAPEWRAAVRHALDDILYTHLVCVLIYIESTFRWIEAHPQLMGQTAPWVAERLAGLLEAEGPLRALLAPESIPDAHVRTRNVHASGEGDDRFRKVFSEGPIGMAIVSADLRVLEVNSALCSMLGYREFELVGRHFSEFTHPDDVAIDVDLAGQMLAGHVPSYKIEKRYVTKRGDVVWGRLSASVFRDRDGTALCGIGMVENIDAHKKAEAAVAEYMHDLERSNRELEEFTHMVSHDLKEPVRTTSGFASLLEQALAGTASATVEPRDLASSIAAGCEQMTELVDGLLEWAGVGDSAARHVEVDLRAVVAQALDRLDALVSDTDAVVHVGDLPALRGDPVLLTQVFQNLFGNALKFRAERRPELRITSERVGGEWRVAVSDNGVGIPAAHAERVFGMFERLHARDDHPGSGVGLAVCRKIVERHGGRIWVDPTRTAGTRIVIALPAAA